MTSPLTQIPLDKGQLDALLSVVGQLRGPNGCPWDLEQTHQTLTQYAIEETMELVEAIETGNDNLLKEELGDVLFQVALHTTLAQERGAFEIRDVIAGICEKLIRRHPHVFADVKVENSAEVIANWEKIKKAEKQGQKQMGFGLPNMLSALQTAFKIGKKTEKSGFDWANANEVLEKVDEELQEFKAELKAPQKNQERIEEELGDLLFAISQISRHLEIEPETALRKANRKFEKRYFGMVKIAESKGLNFDSLSIEQKEKLWQEVKVAGPK